MNDDQARKLATRCIDTWPNSAKAYVWRDILAPLDALDAANAYRELTAHSDRGTPAQFLAAYHGIRRRHQAEDTGGIDPRYWDNAISFAQYIERVTARAGRGDQEAVDELERWERFAAQGNDR